MDVMEWAAEQVPGYPGPPAASLPAPPREPAQALAGPACRPDEDLAGLGDRELLAIAGSLPPGSGRRAAARELLVSRYGHLVRACARRYSRGPEPAEDLMQVGYVGLLKAIGNFDPAAAGAGGLAAFAQAYVSGEVKKHFRDKRWPVRVPRPLQELVLQVRAEAGQLAQDLGRAAAEPDLARHLGVTGEALREARRAELAFQPGSLDAPLSGEPGGATLADLLGAEDPRLERMLGMRAVATHWGELPPREQEILIMRFYGDMTQAQIGQQLGISQMQVSRLNARALAHLRTRLLGQQDHPAGAARPGNRLDTRGLADTRPHGATAPDRPGNDHESRRRLLQLDADGDPVGRGLLPHRGARPPGKSRPPPAFAVFAGRSRQTRQDPGRIESGRA
jgi:RNA polymerase sigma-B factor